LHDANDGLVMLSEEDDCFSEPDQKPGSCKRLVPCISDHCVRGPPCVRASPHVPPFRSPCGSGRGAGEGEGAPAVRRSTGTEDVAHPSHRERATHPLPANGSYPQRSGTYRLECHWRIASTSRFLIILAVRAAVCSFLFRQRSPYATLRSSYIASVS
jgi:hypothetical protein